ncbi:transaldolase [SAR202 cluster bacterium AC-647-N09_OGT_505m]|nr:transaldolase [SAR202 cluster bacterium AC-647-N09_OGT_505m]
MSGLLQEVQRLGQSVWYDNISRGLLASGEIESLIRLGVTGLTSNPTIFEKAVSVDTDYDDTLLSLAREGHDPKETYEMLAIEDIRRAADLLRPVYDRTDGRDGYASLEVSPALAHNTETTIAEAQRLFATLDRPNIMIKVPATPEGIPAVRCLIGQGINVNVTLIFSIDAHHRVMEAYVAGLEDLAQTWEDLSKVASVASFFVSRVDTAVDTLLEERIRQGNSEAEALRGKVAIANAKLAYQSFKDVVGGERFAALQAKGARVQKPLWGSTGTKNATYSDVLYVDCLIGRDTVNTMPPATLTAFMEHGRVMPTLEDNVDDARQTMKALAAVGVNMEEVTDKLLADGVKAFAYSFDQLLSNVEEKKTLLLTQVHEPQVSATGTV